MIPSFNLPSQLDLKSILPFILIYIFWILPWKGVALWKAVKKNHKKWFIAILVFNTFAILEMIYIFIFSKKSPKISNN